MPIDPITTATVATAANLGLNVAGNVATLVLQHKAATLKRSAAGKALTKLGILKPDFRDHLRVALASAVTNLTKKYIKYQSNTFDVFVQDWFVVDEIRGVLLEGRAFDESVLLGRLALAENSTGSKAEFTVSEFSNDLIDCLSYEFSRNVDPGVVWLSQQVVNVANGITRIENRITDLRNDVTTLFHKRYPDDHSQEYEAFEASYLHALSERFSRLTTLGARELHGVQQKLSIAYISLNIRERGDGEPAKAESFLAAHPHIVVRGPAGSGKTTLLSWLTTQCADTLPSSTNPWMGGIPFFVPLRTVARQDVGTPDVQDFVNYSIDPNLWAVKTPEGWINNVLKSGRAILMVDGVDELPGPRRPKFWDWLTKFSQLYPQNRIIVTSRTLPGTNEVTRGQLNEQWNVPPGFAEAVLEEMSDTDINEFVQHWHNSVLPYASVDDHISLQVARDTLPLKLFDPANRRIRELCSSPLLCAMVCVLHWREEGYLPRQRVDLYDKCCDMLIEARDLKREILPPAGPLRALTKNDKELVLQRLAFEMMHSDFNGQDLEKDSYRIEIPKQQAVDWISRWIPSFQSAEAREAVPDAVLTHLLERTGLLREPSTGLVDFPHRTFQEYLAACAAGAESKELFLAKQANDDQWHETIMLAAGTPTGGVAFGRRLIEALLSRGENNRSQRERSQRTRKTCYALALGSLENLRQQDPSLRSKVLEKIAELVPPRNESDATILAVAGDSAVSYLEYSTWRQESTQVAAACARALRLIGTTAAIAELSHYKYDHREAVLGEVCRSGQIRFCDVPALATVVNGSGRLPDYVPVADLRMVLGLDKLTRLNLVGSDVKNLDLIDQLLELDTVSLATFPMLAASRMPWPGNIKSLLLNEPAGDDFSWISSLPSLTGLTLAGAENLRSGEELGSCKNLTSLFLLRCGIVGIEGISNAAPHIQHLNLSYCLSLDNIKGLPELRNLSALTIDTCNLYTLSGLSECDGLEYLKVESCIAPIPKISNSASISELEFTDCPLLKNLSIVSSPDTVRSITLSDNYGLEDLSDLATFSHLVTLSVEGGPAATFPVLPPVREFRVANLPKMPDISFLRGADGLDKLTISACGLLENLSGLADNVALKRLSLSFLPSLRRIDRKDVLSSLQRLELYHCPSVEDWNIFECANSLESVLLHDCPQINDLSPFVSDHLVSFQWTGFHDVDFSPLEDARNLKDIVLSRRSQMASVPENLKGKVRFRNVSFMPSEFRRKVPLYRFARHIEPLLMA